MVVGTQVLEQSLDIDLICSLQICVLWTYCCSEWADFTGMNVECGLIQHKPLSAMLLQMSIQIWNQRRENIQPLAYQ